MNSSLSLQDSTIKIPPLLTQEVKLEPEATTSIHLPPSTCYLDNPALKNQSTLVNMLSYIQSMRAIFEAKEPKTLPWSLVMHDPVNLTSLSKYKSEYEKINLEVKPQPPVAKRKRVVRGPYKKRKKPQEASAQPENISVKKEDQIEESGKCSTSEKDKNSASKDPAKKKPQNRIKNIPGLIVQRVRSSIKTFFAQEPSAGFADRRLAYVSRTLGHLNKSEREKLLTFLEGYEKSWKTWNTIQKYLRGNRRYGNMLHDAVIEFFGEDGRQDFEEWLTAGKMCPKTKQAVIEMKDKIYRKYCHLLDPEDKEGKPRDDDIRGPPGPEKIVKKEEC